jgi:hypothetical protein
MTGNVAVYVWRSFAMGGLLCALELAGLALRYRSIRQHIGWRRS